MSNIIFSPAAVFRLQQLNNRIYKQAGIRHKLSDTAGIISVLAKGKMSHDNDIKECYKAFLSELDDHQIDDLMKNGILPPPSVSLRPTEKRHQLQR